MLLLVLLSQIACTTDKAAPAPTDSVATDSAGTVDTATTGPGWCAVNALFRAQCNACHSASGHAGGLDLATDPLGAMVGHASSAYAGRTLVVAGDPDASFLVVKLEDTQGAGEGGVMPPRGALPAADIALVRAWIAAGATESCGGGNDTSPPTQYHPDGWAAPTRHGMDAKYQRDTCTTCHGADLTGGSSGVSCDSCHAAGWRTNCTFCHGGTETSGGAPPRDIDNLGTSLAFGPHTTHVTGTDHHAYTCTECHLTPASATSPGHFIVGDSTPGVAEVFMADGLSSAGRYATGSCSNLYCHGNGRTGSGAVASTATVSCGSCHGVHASGESAWSRMSGEHHKHVNDANLTCDTCHGTVVDNHDRIVGADLHVNGTKEVVLPAGITWSGSTCTGTCHGENHRARHW